MYKSIDIPALNSVVISGTLLGLESREGTAKASGKPYRSVNSTIRVNQFYNGKEEVSEIPVSFIAMKFKKDGTNNPVYETLGAYSRDYFTAQRDGIEKATKVLINGRKGNGAISENMYADSRNPENVLSTWNINASFLSENRGSAPVTGSSEYATFDTEIFILNMDRELTAEGEETGRLKIRGGIVKYGRKIDCLDFFVEIPSAVDYIERNYNVNDTVHVKGRVRFTSEQEIQNVDNGWGESIPTQTTRKRHELIISEGNNEPLPEENSYDPEDIRVLIADRNALKEQKKMEARAKATTAKASPATEVSKAAYSWE